MEAHAAVEIHDSTLKLIESSDDDLVAVITAYVHRSPGRPGVDAGTGWSQTLQLRFLRGHATGNLETIPMELLDGRLDASGESWANLIPLPLNRLGPTTMELRGWNDLYIVIAGDGVTSTFLGPARYIEKFEASEGPTR